MTETVEELHEKLTDIDNSLPRLFLVRRIQNLKAKGKGKGGKVDVFYLKVTRPGRFGKLIFISC